MSCLTIIDNYISNTQTTVTYTDDDFARVETHWNGSDVLLRELNNNGHFNDHDTWSLLTIDEWYILLARTIELFSALDTTEQFDNQNTTVQSFNFVVMGILRKIYIDTKQHINFVRLQIMHNGEFSMNTTGCVNLVTNKQQPKPTLHVVVDNGH